MFWILGFLSQVSEVKQGCYLSSWELLEGLEGQVGDQVPGVPDDWLNTTADVGGGQTLAVPQTKSLLLGQIHAAQISVDEVPPETKRKKKSRFRVISQNLLKKKEKNPTKALFIQ